MHVRLVLNFDVGDDYVELDDISLLLLQSECFLFKLANVDDD